MFTYVPAKAADEAQTWLRLTRRRRTDYRSVPAAEVSWKFVEVVRKIHRFMCKGTFTALDEAVRAGTVVSHK